MTTQTAAPAPETPPTNPLDDLMTRHPLPTWRLLAWPVMILLALLVVWANFVELDEVSVATGEVVPSGRLKVIQHLEGGIVEAIHVAEGDVVAAGDPLIQLDLATSGVNREELQVRLDGRLLARARLRAEASGKALSLPEDVAARRPPQAAAERKAFDARKRELTSTLGVLRGQVRQKELETEELGSRKRSVEKNLELARERLKLSASLLADGLVPRMEHLQLEAEVEDLEGELQGLVSSIPRAQAAVAEARERVREGEIRFRREAQEELGKTQQAIAQIEELLAEATEQRVRAEIKSPIDGVVKNLRFNTIGGVISPGEAIMEIVPTGDRLVVEAKLNPTDRGYVQVGQEAVVKVTTYDFVRYGGLDGEVILVAPDSSTDPNTGAPYFRVVVETDKTYLGDEVGRLPITPGMQATVDIHTGEKSVTDYLIRPVLKMRHEAFRER